ncbi:putrescine aminopropyltransferase [Emydomyces testavorans]|uniref:Putrescine aminopropyltransferase n=1 Tax=Emydomyces testavorans TaxID=2070801 RepID=A0AAF0DEQ5_9EURO|nr:putrescine aminopropyltransferase [Emydomyces testavorans]
MTEITHPTIKDGWFSEISEMWPGQAMTLRVNQILHHEKSKYQDVLVFESSDHGTVLVLDNVIQCTERDEFSYQEMITHLAMNSHPNPKKVLVIGGGDGGVLREVVKHESVEEAILCDIDEAVIRVSKKYLPGMSIGFQHPNTKVHVGDGFKFLEERKNEFDVIITDSSDPEGPAEVLFQKPYFELLYGSLRDGGVISTQGCSSPFFFWGLLSTFLLTSYPPTVSVRPYGRASDIVPCSPISINLLRIPHFLAENQWLHIKLITDLKKLMKEVFPVVEYAYTTIPTYPSGQIGFLVACKDPNRNIREPVRSWTREEEDKLCRYYNSEIHRASFVLPSFARKALE